MADTDSLALQSGTLGNVVPTSALPPAGALGGPPVTSYVPPVTKEQHDAALGATQQALTEKQSDENAMLGQFERDNARYHERAARWESQQAHELGDLNKWDAEKELRKREVGIWDQFASPAFVLAMLGSTFSTTPLNSALTSGGIAMQAMKDGRMEDYQRAFDAWKSNTDLAMKRFDMEHKLHSEAAEDYTKDMEAFRIRKAAVAERFGDKALKAMLDNDMWKEYFEAVDARSKSAIDAQKAADTIWEANGKMRLIDADIRDAGVDPNKDPGQYFRMQQEKLKAYEAKTPELKAFYESEAEHIAATGKSRSAEEINQWRASQQAMMHPGKSGPLWDIARRMFPDDDQKQADWVAAQDLKSRPGAAGGTPTLTPDGARIKAQQLWNGNTSATQGMGRNAANMGMIFEEIAKIGSEKGLTPEETAKHLDDAANAFAGQKGAVVQTAKQAANIVGAAARAEATIPEVIERSKAVDRSRFSDINAIMLAARERSGDKNVVRFGVALQTLISNYAQVISNGRGVTTDSARHEARDIIQRNWSQGQLEAGLQQLRREIAREIQGAYKGLEYVESRTAPRLDEDTGGLPQGVTVTKVK